MINVYISPNYINAPLHADNGGIRRVVEAEIKHLGKFDIQVVSRIKEADVIQNHGGSREYAPGVPLVNSNHGMMWSRQPWGDGMQDTNAQLVESMAWSQAWTVPSDWVARAIRRGMLIYPEVVYHGVDANEFSVPSDPGNYVLWNKARTDHVSDPADLMILAGYMLDTNFITTFGNAGHNVKVIGKVPHAEMKDLVAHAGVYLATARETFGIGTLEAMACGVPVAGWNWGGQEEIIVPGETGWLAPPGDYKALAECVRRCFADRERLGRNARADVESRWRWEPRIEQYAGIFKRVYEKWYAPRPTVSVIVTTYQLDRFLPQCLNSVLRQSFPDWECLIVDDANSHETWKIAEAYERLDKRFKYLATPSNLGLPGARNFGFANAKGKFIRHLDADDWLDERALQIETNALEAEPGWHIVYGHLAVVNEDGSQNKTNTGEPERSGWPPPQFDWLGQMAHLNQLPSCVMARREVFERSGGYRERMKRNEDAEFWCRVTSLGFRARKVTDAVTYYHRMRNDSKGALEWQKDGKEPDWTANFPWRVGAGDYQEAVQILRKHSGNHPKPHLVPFGAQGQAPKRRFWYVHDYAYPVVSVIVTVGPGHEKYMLDALDSVWSQSYPDWECIVVNDTGKAWDQDIMGAPWAKVIQMDGNQGASKARNRGFAQARGRYIAWLDADDIWLPWFLDVMVSHAERNPGLIFSDMLSLTTDGLSIYRYADFNAEGLPLNMRYAGTSVLIPRDIVQAVFDKQGGWDTEIPGKEDHDWQIAIHSLGFCAYHVPEPLFVYRVYSTTKREKEFLKIDMIEDYLNQKWREFRLEGKKMPCNCGNTKKTSNPPASLLSSSGNFAPEQLMPENRAPEQLVRMEYVGPRAETFSLRSQLLPAKMYRFGNNPLHREQIVFMKDAEWMLSMMDGEKPTFRIVQAGATMETRDPSAALGIAIQG